jgi:hypothetical protein
MKQVVAIVAVLVTLGGAFAGINAYFAKASDVKLVALRLDQKILNDRYNAIQERIWMLEGKYGDLCRNAPQEVKIEYRKLQLELKKLERELKRLKP